MSRQTRFIIYLIITTSLAGVWCYANTEQPLLVFQTHFFFVPDKQTKFIDCKIDGKYPDHACTPGEVIATATKERICTPGYSKGVRNVSELKKNQVYAEYGIAHHVTGEYEVDHFISLELGGSNDISNLFPEAANPTPGFHEKNKVENYLHDKVCSGALPLNEAQREIATDWYAVYVKNQ